MTSGVEGSLLGGVHGAPMIPDHYMHLHPVGTDTCDSAKSDEELAAEGWWCPSCRGPRPRTGAIGFQITESKPVSSPVSGAAFYGVFLARRDFLSSLGDEHVARDLMLGTLFGSSGAPIEGWVTVRGRHPVIVRGCLKKGFDRYVGTRVCEECGSRTYFAYPPSYLYPAPDPKAAILVSQLSGLVVRPDLIAHLDLKRKKGFGIEKLKVLDRPRDGLGALAATFADKGFRSRPWLKGAHDGDPPSGSYPKIDPLALVDGADLCGYPVPGVGGPK